SPAFWTGSPALCRSYYHPDWGFRLKVVYLAAGASGMLCGSCLRDNRLAATLLAPGHAITLIPLYTPLRTDEADVSARQISQGGSTVYLEQKASLLRHVPRFLSQPLDSPAIRGGVGRLAAGTRPEALGELTPSILRGEEGRQRRELDVLIAGLRGLRPDVI